MKRHEYHIEQVEFIYNGDDKKFDAFLNAVIRDYVSADKITPDTVVKDEDQNQNSNTKSLDFPVFM